MDWSGTPLNTVISKVSQRCGHGHPRHRDRWLWSSCGAGISQYRAWHVWVTKFQTPAARALLFAVSTVSTV